MFNSALVYELSALSLRRTAIAQVEPGQPGYIEAKSLLAFLQWFEPVPRTPSPTTRSCVSLSAGGTWSASGRSGGKHSSSSPVVLYLRSA